MDGTSWYVFYGCVQLHLVDRYTLASMLTHCERYLKGLLSLWNKELRIPCQYPLNTSEIIMV